MAQQAMLDADRFVKPGYEEAYNKLLQDMNSDLARINRGEEPTWLSGQRIKTTEGIKQLTEEEARGILREAGGDKEKARQIARQRGYNF